MYIKKIINSQIVAILYGIDDEIEAEQMTESLLTVIIDSQMKLAENFLLERGVSKEEVDTFMKDENFKNEKIEQLLNSEEMSQLYIDSYNAIVDLIYNQQLQVMDDSAKEKLNQVLEMEERLKEISIQQIDTDMEIIKLVDDVRKTNGLTEEQIDQVLGDAYDKAYNKNSAVIPSQSVVEEVRQEASPSDSELVGQQEVGNSVI